MSMPAIPGYQQVPTGAKSGGFNANDYVPKFLKNKSQGFKIAFFVILVLVIILAWRYFKSGSDDSTDNEGGGMFSKFSKNKKKGNGEKKNVSFSPQQSPKSNRDNTEKINNLIDLINRSRR